MARTLPPLPELAERIARELGGVSHVLWAGDYPSAAIQLGDRHPLLIRDHGWTLTLSLPRLESWRVATEEDWQEAVPEIQNALASRSHPIAMADAVLAFSPVLERITGSAWVVGFPGTPVPQEVWFRHESRSVGLFQGDDGVRIVIWVDHDMTSMSVRDPAEFASLAGWLETEVGRQKQALDAAEAEAKRVAALPLPEFEQVMTALKAGIRIRVGGGRYSEKFFWENGALFRDIFDEGDSYVTRATEAELREHIRLYPEAFREALRM